MARSVDTVSIACEQVCLCSAPVSLLCLLRIMMVFQAGCQLGKTEHMQRGLQKARSNANLAFRVWADKVVLLGAD